MSRDLTEIGPSARKNWNAADNIGMKHLPRRQVSGWNIFHLLASVLYNLLQEKLKM